MGQARGGVFAFEGYTLDLTRGCVSDTVGEIELRPKSFELLSYLVANPGRLISKDELVNAVWPDVIVSDDSLAQCVSDVRRALSDPRRQIIKTVRRRGYLFAAPVSGRPPQSAGSWTAAAAGTPAPRLSVVVLPFANLSSDPEQEYFADGISDDLTADLSLIPDSFVIARTTAFSYKGKPVDVRQIGRELGVCYVLEGSVRRAGGQVQVTAQLIDTESGSHIWADRFDADRADLAKAQEEIVGRLYQTMQLELIEAAASRIEEEKPANPDARDLVIRGWALYNRPKSTANQEAALRAFEQALDIHPASVEARVGIATVLGEYLALGWRRSPEDMARAEQMLVEASARNRNHLRALFEMGRLRRLQNRLSESKIELEKAIALDRNHSAAMLQLGITLLFLGQPQAALPHLEKTMRLRPLLQNIFFPYYWMGYSHLLLAHIDEAIDLMRKCRAANPKLPDTHMLLAAALALRGEIDEAKTSLAEALRLNLWFKSFAQLHGDAPAYMTNPAFVALREQTVEAGLRRIGFPAE